MSGHSKWSTIKRQKEATDAKRGQLFSKLARAITIAAKQGSDPGVNLPLKLAIERAREANMPKENIERALKQVQAFGSEAQARRGKLGGGLEEVTYEGYGPHGVAVLVEAATDNRNRTAQEIKNLFERGGGSLGGPGSVAFQFEKKGLIVLAKGETAEDFMLKLIDLGVPDLEETEDGIEVYVEPGQLSQWREKAEKAGFEVKSSELVNKPKVYVSLEDAERAKKVLSFLDSLDEHEDVQRVYANLDIPLGVLNR